ncbi:MAG: phospholipase D-like domain-containing protein [Elusimicrobiota bacterium]|nr:MAG: phospholipase D-like domain-containing protein [Elusimicrobiota bacterium]
MRLPGAPLALLLAAALPAFAGLPDASWSSLSVSFAPAVRPQAVAPAAAAPTVPAVSFKGLVLKSVQFSRADRIPESLAAAIDKTEKTLDLALYDLKLAEAADAILRAHRRGVKVRLIYDMGHAKPPSDPAAGGGASPEYSSLVAAGVPVRLLKGGGSFGIMHHKFALLDGELLITGSFNWTRAADEKNFENMVFKTDAALIEGFTRCWNWMWPLGKEPQAAAAELASGVFGSEEDEDVSFSIAAEPSAAGPGAPPADPSRPVSFGGAAFPRYAFSPQGGVEALLIDAIGRSKKRIDVAIFSMYSMPVAQALVAAKKRGVAVKVVADAGQSRRSQAVRALFDGGVPLRLLGGRDGGLGVMHHKYALFDGAMLMSGSYNFSQNAELYNFEADLFTTAAPETAAFAAESALLWKQAKAPADGDLAAPKEL